MQSRFNMKINQAIFNYFSICFYRPLIVLEVLGRINFFLSDYIVRWICIVYDISIFPFFTIFDEFLGNYKSIILFFSVFLFLSCC